MKVLQCVIPLLFLICAASAQCAGAPDGFWEDYNKEMQENLAAQKANPSSEQPTQPEAPAQTDQEILDQIEREAHGSWIGDEVEESWFTEEVGAYIISAVFGFCVLLPFWAPLFSQFFASSKQNGLAKEDAAMSGVDVDMKGWFCEVNDQWPGQAAALQIKKLLLHKRTEFQEILVFESVSWGKVMCLDGVIQITEKDEMSYQEMLAHTPMFLHPNPARVLIVGGGDGGILRELVKHDCVETLRMCEIDKEVIAAARKYFELQSSAFDDSRLEILCEDALKYCAHHAELVKAGDEEAHRYDVVIVDSSDPDGPAAGLFEPEFYNNVHMMLRPGGVMCAQGESLWLNLDLIKKLKEKCAAKFVLADYASIQIPTYPSGQIGAFVCVKNAEKKNNNPESCAVVRRKVPKTMHLRYYTAELHTASFVLPKFAQDALA